MSTVRRRVDKWIKPYAALWLTLLVGGSLVVAFALLGAEVYVDVVDDEGLSRLDIPALEYSQTLRNPGLDAFVTGFTNIGGGVGMPILASILTGWLTFLSRTWRPVILVGGAAAVSIYATTVGKRLVGRTRPDHSEAVPPFEDSPSFPSGHTLNTTVVIGVLLYVLCLQVHKLWVRVTAITAGVAFIIAMGLSRVFLGHHWLTDVTAGWLLGGAWVGMVILAHRLFHLTRRKQHVGPAPTFDRPVVRDVVAEKIHDHLPDHHADRPGPDGDRPGPNGGGPEPDGGGPEPDAQPGPDVRRSPGDHRTG